MKMFESSLTAVNKGRKISILEGDEEIGSYNISKAVLESNSEDVINMFNKKISKSILEGVAISKTNGKIKLYESVEMLDDEELYDEIVEEAETETLKALESLESEFEENPTLQTIVDVCEKTGLDFGDAMTALENNGDIELPISEMSSKNLKVGNEYTFKNFDGKGSLKCVYRGFDEEDKHHVFEITDQKWKNDQKEIGLEDKELGLIKESLETPEEVEPTTEIVADLDDVDADELEIVTESLTGIKRIGNRFYIKTPNAMVHESVKNLLSCYKSNIVTGESFSPKVGIQKFIIESRESRLNQKNLRNLSESVKFFKSKSGNNAIKALTVNETVIFNTGARRLKLKEVLESAGVKSIYELKSSQTSVINELKVIINPFSSYIKSIKENLENSETPITPELEEKLEKCESLEEINKKLSDEGIELSESQEGEIFGEQIKFINDNFKTINPEAEDFEWTGSELKLLKDNEVIQTLKADEIEGLPV